MTQLPLDLLTSLIPWVSHNPSMAPLTKWVTYLTWSSPAPSLLVLVHDVEITDPGISDYHAIITSLGIQKPPNITKTIHYRKFKLTDIDKFITNLSSSKLTTNPPSSLGELIQVYNNTLTDTLDSHAPLRSKTVTVRPECKWFNNELSSTKPIMG